MVQFKGFDDFAKKLDKMAKAASGEVSFEVLFDEPFMRKYTNFQSIQEFFDKSPFTVETPEDFEKLDESELDEYIRQHTRLDSWETMKGKAGEEYFAKKLKF